MDFIANNWEVIASAIIVIGGIVFSATLTVKSKLYNIAYYLVCKAEALLGSKTGEIKKAAVFTWIREKLPASVRWFITDSFLDGIVEKAVGAMKDFLTNNPDVTITDMKLD